MDIKINTFQQVLIFTLYFSNSEAATTGVLPEGRLCACVGERLIYYCSVVGGIATIWKGTALDCPLDGSEITLRHSQFASNQVIGVCNDGDIIGHGIAVLNNCYTSQLNVTVRESFDNKTVQCMADSVSSNEGMRIAGESILNVISVSNLPPDPRDLHLADAQSGKLIFSWTVSDCSNLRLMYSITSDCGTCPVVTNTTAATCSGLQLSTNAVLCHFKVSSVACGVNGDPSSPLEVTLKVPNTSQVQIIPSYSNDSQALEKLFINNRTEDVFVISGGISGSPTSYTVHVTNNISSITFNSTLELTACEKNNGCPIKLPSSYCSESSIINMTISAANKLGEGPHSDPYVIECTNNFVQVTYEKTTTEPIISCVYLKQSDTSHKTCCITYNPCDQDTFENTQLECNEDFPYNIHLDVSDHSRKTYCYTVTASNDTYTIKVTGNFSIGIDLGGNINAAAIAIGIIISLLSIFMLTSLGIVIILVAKKIERKKSRQLQDQEETHNHPLKQYLNPIRLPDTLNLHYVDRDCKLLEYITKTLADKFISGHAYYEFTNKVENIPEFSDVLLLQDKEGTEKWFRLSRPQKVAAGGLILYGQGIARSSFGEQYRVFIQSFGSGDRHLPKGSSIIYKDQV